MKKVFQLLAALVLFGSSSLALAYSDKATVIEGADIVQVELSDHCRSGRPGRCEDLYHDGAEILQEFRLVGGGGEETAGEGS